MRKAVEAILADAIRELHTKGGLRAAPKPEALVVERPRLPAHGDWASGVALGLARAEKRSPMRIAESIAAEIKDPEGLFE
ncbi:MAG: arginine--tRNA ligase, partial [Vicinamibacteria bacterium]